MWFVLTGSPSSGKTTVLERLRNLGYTVFPDEGRRLSDDLSREGRSRYRGEVPEAEFQLRLLDRKLTQARSLSITQTNIFDYGLPCSLVWCEVSQVKLEERLKRAALWYRYRGVFLFEQLPFERDETRCESTATRSELFSKLRGLYTELGYKPILVPRFANSMDMSVSQRTKFVHDTIVSISGGYAGFA